MSSSYYYSLYKEEERKVKEFEKWIRQLQPIRENASVKLDDEIQNVNREINKLGGDLEDAVKHDKVFAAEAYEIGSSVEAGSGSDSCLRATQSAIDDEIRDLGRKKEEAERNMDKYYRLYEEEKRREEEEARRKRDEALSKIADLFR